MWISKFDENIAEYALMLASRMGEYAEAYLERSYSTAYSMEQGELTGGAFNDSTGLRIRIISEKKLYTLSTNKIEESEIRALLDKLIKFNGKEVEMSEERVEQDDYVVREKEIIEDEALLSSLLEIDKRVKGIGYVKYRSVYADAGKATSYFVNSDGTRIGAELPYVSAFAAMTVSAGGDSRQRMLQFGGTGGLELFDPGAICERLESEAGALRNVIKTGKTLAKAELAGITNVVVSPEIIGIAVHESIGHPSEADRVFGREAAQAGTSYLGPGDLGIEIGSEKVTIADDPTIKGSYGFYLYDDEGVKARKKVIVRGGKQDALLVNREYANDLKIRSNSSARSDMYSNEPLVRMSNTYLERGELGLEELVEVAKEGIYIKSFTEWNIDDTRSFARYQGNEAYLIRNGRISTPVKNYALEAKTLDFWHAVRELGSDFELTLGECGKGEPVQGVPVTMGGPHALLCFG